MAKKKDIVPFFRLRHQSADTLEAMANEMMMTIQTLTSLLELDAISLRARPMIQERADALRKLCMEGD